jgi:hypothetical protein
MVHFGRKTHMAYIGKSAQLCVIVVMLAAVAVSPAFALWGDTGAWTKNANVLKTRNPAITGVVIPGFGDPIEEGTGCHGYVIGVDETNGKVCAITAQHCMVRQTVAYGDHFPGGTIIEAKFHVADDIGLYRVADARFREYDRIKRATPRLGESVRVVSRTQTEGVPGRAIYCRGRIYALHPEQIDDGIEVNLTHEDCEQGRSATGFTFDSGSPITTPSGALVGVTNSQCDSSAPGEGQGICEGELERHPVFDRVAGNNPSVAGVDVGAGLVALGCTTYDRSWDIRRRHRRQ